jgi:two-component system chemotaxis sensor kinase CheA
MDPETCYLGFEIALQTRADKAAIEAGAFEFVRDDCTLLILPPRSMVSEYIQQLQQHEGDLHRLGDMLVACGTLTQQELQVALGQQASHALKSPLALFCWSRARCMWRWWTPHLPSKKQIKEAAATENRSIRVDADKLDQLINLVGELIIAGASVNLIAQRAQVADLQESTSKLSMLVEEVRDSALQLRMVKIGATFNRFQRVVHDVARDLGKDVALVIHGEDTELDKTVVEKIGDPLMHLVRNSLDHGIESAELRAERGKPAQGTLTLNAFHDSGSIVITVQDDGGGLNRERVLAKALERGLVEPGQHLSDSDIYALIFEPGFSTAEKVTNLSGRGVGMDVVKRNIAALRGYGGHQQRRGARHHRHRAPAADAGHHRRLFGRCGQGRVRHSAGHD